MRVSSLPNLTNHTAIVRELATWVYWPSQSDKGDPMNEVAAPLTKRDVARLAHVSPRTIERWIRAGEIPAPRRLGPRRVFWHPETIQRWLAERLGVTEVRRRGRPRSTA